MKKFKMTQLKLVKKSLNYMGVLSESDGKQCVKQLLVTFPMLTLLVPLCAYFVYHKNNVVNATEVFYVIAASILCILQYWFLIAKRRQLADLMSELHVLIDQSKHLIKSTIFFYLSFLLSIPI